jgi:hypothetical protein
MRAARYIGTGDRAGAVTGECLQTDAVADDTTASFYGCVVDNWEAIGPLATAAVSCRMAAAKPHPPRRATRRRRLSNVVAAACTESFAALAGAGCN